MLAELIAWIVESFVELFHAAAPRFIVCLLLAIAADVLIFWLVSGSARKILLAVAVTLAGIVVGAIWERRGRCR